MGDATVTGGGAPARGEVRVPGDKSISHRAVLFGALADGETRARGLGTGADVRATRAAMQAMGVEIVDDDGAVVIRGRGHRALRAPGAPVDCGNSGTTMRLLSGVIAGAGIEATLVGDESLNARPMARVLAPLRDAGARCQGVLEGGRETAPIRFEPGAVRPTRHDVNVASAQVLSCLCLAGLYAEGDGATVIDMPPGARDHTQRMLGAMGAPIEEPHPGHVEVRALSTPLTPLGDVDIPGDPSSAAFFAAAALAVDGGEISLPNVSLNSTRVGFFRAIERMGATVVIEEAPPNSFGEPYGRVTVSRAGPLRPVHVVEADVPAMVDELPVLAVLAALADGQSDIRGAKELRVKESDRVAAVTAGLRAIGVDLDEHEDGWTIRGGRPLTGGTIEVERDHRIAMSFAIAALAANGPVTLLGAEWIATSFPSFFDELQRVSGASVGVGS
jgi:3-phosphoshikimate 1-carboxyvinyltransferase